MPATFFTSALRTIETFPPATTRSSAMTGPVCFFVGTEASVTDPGPPIVRVPVDEIAVAAVVSTALSPTSHSVASPERVMVLETVAPLSVTRYGTSELNVSSDVIVPLTTKSVPTVLPFAYVPPAVTLVLNG